MYGVLIGFLVFVVIMLALDLGVFHRRAEVITPKQALLWTGIWVSLSLLFCVFVFFTYENHWWGFDLPDSEPDGWNAATLYLTGYLVEESLSADNVFVIAMVMSSFAVPAAYQHKVLFWGIFGAIVMRGLMIIGGAALVSHFHWVVYLFGVLLLISAGRMFVSREKEPPESPKAIAGVLSRFFPITHELTHGHFLVRREGKLMLTPLAVALAVIEVTDLIFAVDSIPAIFAITEEPFLIFTSNVFAILGLRSLYFALAGGLTRFYYLKHALSLLLCLIGVKMLLKDILHHIPNIHLYTLAAVVLVLAAGIYLSLLRDRKEGKQSKQRRANALAKK
ncbi:MAG TPA: TerC family protein [Candidatus Obscuribacterales bacterium]